MQHDETIEFHSRLVLEHRALASFVRDATLRHYHATLADHHAAKAHRARECFPGSGLAFAMPDIAGMPLELGR